MDKWIRSILDSIPPYERFYTLQEMDDSSCSLAEAHPDCVRLREIGRTREGRPLLLLSIDSGLEDAENALLLGCPHPNEPIGAMMLEHFSQVLAEDPALRRNLGYNWHILKAWDADGLARNEGWFAGPYTITNYFRHYFRPAGPEQVDWTFPLDYKKLSFHETIPETEAVRLLIDELHPRFMYTLHNSGFGGAYWYMTQPLWDLFEPLKDVASAYDVPLHLGEPESTSTTVYAPAFFANLGLPHVYDYMERNGQDMNAFASSRRSGDCSSSYAGRKYGTLTLVTELPYFIDERILDLSSSGVIRRDAMRSRIEVSRQADEEIRDILSPVLPLIGKGDPRIRAVLNFTGYERAAKTGGSAVKSSEEIALEKPEQSREATVAELFDMRYVSRFYKLQNYGMAMQALDEAWEKRSGEGSADAEHAAEEENALHAARDRMRAAFEKHAAYLEEQVDYRIVPIRQLVAVQLASGLLVAQELRKDGGKADKAESEGIQ